MTHYLTASPVLAPRTAHAEYRAMLDAHLTEIALRLLVAAIIGGLIGLNRELHDKPAGLRTHALVALGAALVVVMVAPPGIATGSTDALSRVIQGVVTGIGFLGAGVILRDPGDRRVHGLTTAAGVWVTALFGMAAGAGQFVLVGVGSTLMLVVLVLGVPIEALIHRRDGHRVGKDESPPPNLP
jgi:putative Mg2+ transporter-C (MgtC) family protein